jgi:hypothetical protein
VISQRTIPEAAFRSHLDIAALGGALGYTCIGEGYTNAANAKNMACNAFLKLAQHGDSALVLLDGTKCYRPDIVQQMVQVEAGVVVGLDALLVRRWALAQMQWYGHEYFFKHQYRGSGLGPPDEDAYFIGAARASNVGDIYGVEECDEALEEGAEQPEPPQQEGRRVFWAVPLEREILSEAFGPFLSVAMCAGEKGYLRLGVPVCDTPTARNRLCELFLKNSARPDDTLVMLDADHAHPQDVVERLALRPEGVVGALYFRRGPPHDPLWFVRRIDGTMAAPAECGPYVYPCACVGTGAIAIKRWVLEKLRAAGNDVFFRYDYPFDSSKKLPSEDVYFGAICEEIGIRHHVDGSLVTQHLAVKRIGPRDWEENKPENLKSSE